MRDLMCNKTAVVFGELRNSSNTHTHTHTQSLARNLGNYFLLSKSYADRITQKNQIKLSCIAGILKDAGYTCFLCCVKTAGKLAI